MIILLDYNKIFYKKTYSLLNTKNNNIHNIAVTYSGKYSFIRGIIFVSYANENKFF